MHSHQFARAICLSSLALECSRYEDEQMENQQIKELYKWSHHQFLSTHRYCIYLLLYQTYHSLLLSLSHLCIHLYNDTQTPIDTNVPFIQSHYQMCSINSVRTASCFRRIRQRPTFFSTSKEKPLFFVLTSYFRHFFWWIFVYCFQQIER